MKLPTAPQVCVLQLLHRIAPIRWTANELISHVGVSADDLEALRRPGHLSLRPGDLNSKTLAFPAMVWLTERGIRFLENEVKPVTNLLFANGRSTLGVTLAAALKQATTDQIQVLEDHGLVEITCESGQVVPTRRAVALSPDERDAIRMMVTPAGFRYRETLVATPH